MAGKYRQFLRLCEEWPVDKHKHGFDLGSVIREKIALGFRQGEHSKVDEKECSRIYHSLSRLNSDHYKNMYPRLTENNVTGWNAEKCRLMGEQIIQVKEESGD